MEKIKQIDTYRPYFFIVLGSFIFALGVNTFLIPSNVYIGGIMGVAQLLRTLLFNAFGSDFFFNIDPTGLFNLIFNIPLLILAYVGLSRRFFARTLLTIAMQSLFLTLLPVQTTFILDDLISQVLIAGIVSGIGLALSFHAGGSSGGLDIVAFYISQRRPNASVGQLVSGINYILYVIFAFIFSIEVAIYSIIYAFIAGIVIDKFHLQNIKTRAIIITKNDEVAKKITTEVRRGVTYWKGYGAYADTPTNVMITLVSKYELNKLKRIVLSLDPQAFIIHSDGNYVIGNFEKRLVS